VKAYALAAALATVFVVVQFYTSLAALAPTPPVGYVFATPPVAAGLLAVLLAATFVLLVRLTLDRAAPAGASRGLLAAWIGSAALCGLLGFDPLSSAQVVGIMLVTGVFAVALVRYYDEPRVAATLLGAYLAAGLLASLGGLIMFVSRRPAALWALNHGRAAGPFVTANQFAAFLIAFIFVAAGAALARRGALRALAAGAGAVALVALAATFSLAGWLGALAAALYLALALGARRVAAGVALCGAVALLALTVRPAAGHNPADTFDRLRIWRSGVRVAELFPLWGVGPMAYWRVYPEIRPPNGDPPGTFGALHPHDAYLSLAGETGAVGLAACGYGWWRFVRAIRPALRVAPPARRKFALGVCAALVAVLVQGVFDTIGIVEMAFVWIPFTALALAAARA
jgi:O-antigen ligase